MIGSPIDVYRRQIERELKQGDATEHTHRPALKALIESLAPGLTATNEPKHRTDCGAPDILVSRSTKHGLMRLGYIEAKDVDKDLSEAEKSDQLKRYFRSLHNLILTDYLEFRWYVDGEHRQTKRLARVSKGGKLLPEKDGAEAVGKLLAEFLAHEAEEINTPKDLALRMARLTHFIRDIIVTAFERNSASATLRDLHGAFEKALIPDLPIDQFADMFAQTLAYGLFAARVNHRGPRGSFRRLGAASEIPKTNPFLRQLFETITGTALDEEPYVAFVDDLAQLLADTDMEAVLADFGKRTAREDPVVHFYETFLAAYDPKMRESRGVYYTPEPVVSYIVRSVDYLLKSRFGLPGGLADMATVEYETDTVAAMSPSPSSPKSAARTPPLQKATSPRVLILDPACGTGTFLYAVVDLIRSEFMRQGNAGMWSGYVRNHLLPRLFGFELLMAPYAVAHFKLGMQLAGHDLTPAQRERWAYDFSGKERVGIFLTNTLEEAEKVAQREFKFIERAIAEEANAAVDIKRNMPILAVIGNPPYSGHSANRSWEIKEGKKVPTFIGQLIRDYYSVDGQPLGEKNPKWLQDDYVKFIRWGQWRIERTGAGILAFITNHGYLDNPTFRGMRQQLMDAFTEIYILNLHGNAKKKERAPDGSKDENVFDIQQGVTLGIFVKEPQEGRLGKVYYSELWGSRDSKNEQLFETDVATSAWMELEPVLPSYLFLPQSIELRPEYETGWRVPDVFPVNASTVTTARNDFSMAYDRATLRHRIGDLRDGSIENDIIRERYALRDVSYWNLKEAREELKEVANLDQYIRDYCYRPFDFRFVFYHTAVCERLRSEVMRHMQGKNVAFLTHRPQSPGDFTFAYCTRMIGDQCVAANKTAGGGNSFQFPLFLCPMPEEAQAGQSELAVQSSPWPAGRDGRRPNLNPKFVANLEKRLGLKFAPEGGGFGRGGLGPPAGARRAPLPNTFGPEDVFNYMYAVFHSPTYRQRYAEFLKIDFPRLPLTSDVNLFRALCEKGAELVALHLLESPRLENPITGYPVKGSNVVEKGFPKYLAPGEPEPVFVAQVPLSGPAALPRLKAGRVYINAVAPDGACPDVIGDRRNGYGVRELAPALESGGKPPQSKPALAERRYSGQYFEGVPPEVWNFHIGGYQVCEKWLKDRRGRTLTYEDLEHYRKVVTAIQETIRLMAEIDAAIPKWPIE
jgi:hypothetical protein